MTGFEPGEGWREVTAQGYVEASATTITLREDGRPDRWWVREEPVPPLPDAPYTVIRVTLKSSGNEAGFTLKQDGSWRGANEDVEAEGLAQAITGFKVLAEPRDVTAKAVLDRVREEFAAHSWSRRYIDTIAGEFEVES